MPQDHWHGQQRGGVCSTLLLIAWCRHCLEQSGGASSSATSPAMYALSALRYPLGSSRWRKQRKATSAISSLDYFANSMASQSCIWGIWRKMTISFFSLAGPAEMDLNIICNSPLLWIGKEKWCGDCGCNGHSNAAILFYFWGGGWWGCHDFDLMSWKLDRGVTYQMNRKDREDVMGHLDGGAKLDE